MVRRDLADFVKIALVLQMAFTAAFSFILSDSDRFQTRRWIKAFMMVEKMILR